jgi:hypothetical protein
LSSAEIASSSATPRNDIIISSADLFVQEFYLTILSYRPPFHELRLQGFASISNAERPPTVSGHHVKGFPLDEKK